MRGICLRYGPDGSVLAHSCVQAVSSEKDKSNSYKQIREVCSKPTLQSQEAGETRRTSLWGGNEVKKGAKVRA